MQITRMIVPKEKYSIKCPYEMTPEFIVIHNTANKASAMAEMSYMIGNNNKVSYHCAVDDYRIVQGVEFNRNTWNASDGVNGKGNRKGIAIEICYSTGDTNQFKKAEELTAKYVGYLLKEFGWGIEKVKKHQDFSSKYCPHKTLDLGWERFLNLIRKELNPNPYIAVLKARIDNVPLRKSKSHTANNVLSFLNKDTLVDLKSIEGEWGLIPQGYINMADFDFTVLKTINVKIDNAPLRKSGSHQGEVITFLKPGTPLDILEINENGFGRAIQGWINLEDC